MSWTYNPGEIASSPLYQVRNIIGDIEEDDPLLQDEEILYALTEVSADVIRASIICCERIASRYMKKSGFKLGPYSIDLSSRADVYTNLANQLKNKVASSGGPSWTGSRPAAFDVGMMSPKEG